MGSDDTLWIFLRMLVALPVVLGMAYLTIRFVLARKTIVPGGRRMRLVETLPLSGKGALVLVEMGGRYFFLACQDQAVVLLKEMEEPPPPLEAASGEWFDWGKAALQLGSPARKMAGWGGKAAALWRKTDPNYLLKAWRGHRGAR